MWDPFAGNNSISPSDTKQLPSCIPPLAASKAESHPAESNQIHSFYTFPIPTGSGDFVRSELVLEASRLRLECIWRPKVLLDFIWREKRLSRAVDLFGLSGFHEAFISEIIYNNRKEVEFELEISFTS